jgi:hypothetical protein
MIAPKSRGGKGFTPVEFAAGAYRGTGDHDGITRSLGASH